MATSVLATEIPTIEATPLREALWKGRQITYRPGRLYVALRRGVNHKKVFDLFFKAGCQIEFNSYNGGVFEVIVPPKDTLRLAGALGTSPMFRYVEPDILEKENFN